VAGELVKSAVLKIRADDGDTEAKLDEISRKADELSAKHPELDVRIKTAEATAKMAVLRKELKDTANSTHDTGLAFSGLARLLGGGGVAEGASGEAAAGADVGLVDSVDALGNSLGTAAAGGSGMAGVLAVLAPVIAAAVAALTPMIAGLALVTAGFGIFGAIAVPEMEKVWKAVTAGGSALKALSPQERALVGPVRDLRSEFSSLSKAIQPEIIKAFATGLNIIKQLMPGIKPLVEAAAKGFDDFLQSIDNWLRSPAGQKFVHWMATEGPVAIHTFIHAILDVINWIGDFAHFLYDTGETMDHNWSRYMHDIAEVVDALRETFVTIGGAIRAIWDNTVSTVISTGNRIVSWFRSLPGWIRGAVAGIPAALYAIGVAALNGLLAGLQAAFGPVISFVEHAASEVSSIFSKVLSILSPSRVFYRHGQNIMAGLLQGMQAGEPAVLSELGRFGAALGAGGVSGAGSGGGLTVEIHAPTGMTSLDPGFWTALGKGIRVRGGDPNILTRKVRFV